MFPNLKKINLNIRVVPKLSDMLGIGWETQGSREPWSYGTHQDSSKLKVKMTGCRGPPLQSAHVCKTWRQQLVHLPYSPNSPGVTGRANLPCCHHCYLWYERSIRIKLVTSDAPWLSLVKPPQEAGSPGPGSSPRPLKESPPSLHSSVYQDGVVVGRM